MTIGGVSPTLQFYGPSDPTAGASSDAAAVDAAHLVLDSLRAQGAMVSSLLASMSSLGQHLDVRV